MEQLFVSIIAYLERLLGFGVRNCHLVKFYGDYIWCRWVNYFGVLL